MRVSFTFAAGFLFLSGLACRGAELEQRINALVDSSKLDSRASIGIHVVDAASGKTLYQRNENRLLLPASNMKLFTTALALLRLGPDYRFETRVVREPSGDLTLVGSGDPSLSGRAFPYRKDAPAASPLLAIEELADQVVASGIERVDGDLIGDDRLYPWVPYPPSWTQDDGLWEYGAPVSALTVADNFFTLSIRPGAHAGDPAVLALLPALEYFTIDNRIATVAAGGEARVRLSRLPGARQLLIWGSIPAGHAEMREELAIEDPALYAASALYEALTRRGVTIHGRARTRHRSTTDDYTPPEGTIVASRTSPPLPELLQVIDKVSQNLHAELMLREVSRVTRHAGTREAGLEELSALLAETGASNDESRAEDGSGLSRNALVTPRLVTRLLTYLYSSKYRDLWISLLPVGGEDGTLSNRLCCVTDGRGISAKTGSLSRALTLSGYADSKSSGRLAFSILVNDFSAPAGEVRQWIDKIATSLLE
jgi:D-alanyl-D-alanine carboxypeptidase/D-alanyl-D-alanine-endopeptidase (penicillin-binding protein 4)